MHTTIQVSRTHADVLRGTLDAIRGETHALKAAGLLDVCADELFTGAGTVHAWIGDLATAIATASGDVVTLPVREVGTLQHLVYSLSAVLVWADELRCEGRMASVIPAEAMIAWNEIERVAGLGGRTSLGLGRLPYKPRRSVMLDEDVLVDQVEDLSHLEHVA